MCHLCFRYEFVIIIIIRTKRSKLAVEYGTVASLCVHESETTSKG